MNMSDWVWNRTGTRDEISKGFFAFVISLFTALGIVASAVTAFFTQGMTLTWPFLIIVLVVGIAGVILAGVSKNPILSLVGYMMVAIPFGAMLGPFVALYTTASVVRVFFVTSTVVVVLGVVGAVIPDSLEGWGSWLLGGITLLLVGLLVVPIAGLFGFPVDRALTVLDWVGVLLFSGYVIYDWNRAMRLPRTADNAIDVALAIYLDWINIFIRLLSLTGTRKSED